MMKTHTSKVVSAYHYLLCKICQLCLLVRQNITHQLLMVFILLPLDYCNLMFSSLCWLIIQLLNDVMNGAALVVIRYSVLLLWQVSSAIGNTEWPHWLPVGVNGGSCRDMVRQLMSLYTADLATEVTTQQTNYLTPASSLGMSVLCEYVIATYFSHLCFFTYFSEVYILHIFPHKRHSRQH